MMTAIKSRVAPTITNEAAIACIGMYCLAVVMGYGRFLFTATLPDIMVQLSLSTTIAGWLASINYIGYFIGALIAMFVPQRATWQAMTLWAIISVVTTMLLVIPNMSLTLWYIIRLIAGIASGVAMILSSSFVIQNLSPERRSILSAVHYAGIGVGIMLIIFIFSYFFADGSSAGVDESTSRIVGAGIMTTYTFFFLAIAGIIYTEISKIFS